MSKNYIDGILIKEHFKRNAFYYVLVSIFALVGIVVGIYISVTGYRYSGILSAGDRNMFGYITGEAPYSAIFYSRLINILLCVVILVVVTLSRFTSFLGFIFLGYQSALMVLSSAAIIDLYGLSGILNVILFIVPINLANFFVLSLILCVGAERAKLQWQYKLKFGESFKENNYFKCLAVFVLMLLALCIFHSFVLPIFLKSFVVVNF